MEKADLLEGPASATVASVVGIAVVLALVTTAHLVVEAALASSLADSVTKTALAAVPTASAQSGWWKERHSCEPCSRSHPYSIGYEFDPNGSLGRDRYNSYGDNDRPMCLKMVFGLIIVVKSLEDPAAPSRDDEKVAFLGKEGENVVEAQCLSSFHTVVTALQNITSVSETAATTLTLVTVQHCLLHDHLHSVTTQLRASMEATVRNRTRAEPMRGTEKGMQTISCSGVDQRT
ncbi:unnamed protein product [Heligmosomoides polygyrus]|uniref:Transmembrane protein n=1 Tax=Heligmosomoides polygyrus TaxID=6339 RepID=A0A183GMB9_HELPZ|nr:unnamed protein product [Heligmosomoides polygyrus]